MASTTVDDISVDLYLGLGTDEKLYEAYAEHMFDYHVFMQSKLREDLLAEPIRLAARV